MEKLIRINKLELAGEPLPFYLVHALYSKNSTYKAEVTYADEYSFENCIAKLEVHKVSDQDLSAHLNVPVSQIDQHVEEMDDVRFFKLIMYLKKNY